MAGFSIETEDREHDRQSKDDGNRRGNDTDRVAVKTCVQTRAGAFDSLLPVEPFAYP